MEVLTAVDAERLQGLLAAERFFWLDLRDPRADEIERVAALLHLHPAAVEDTLEWGQLPKADDYGDHVLLVFFTARPLEPVEVHLHVSGGWIVTVRRATCALDHLHEWALTCDSEDEDEILYHLLDGLTDGWDPVVAEVDARVDEVEAEVLERPRHGHLSAIYRLKQDVGNLLRHAVPQRDEFAGGVEAIHALPGLTRGSRAWLRDVDAHLDVIASDLQRLNGDLSALTDTFFNANANRLNRLATLVAVGSLFFLVWTLVTGFFGQNFGYLVRHIDTAEAFFLYEGLALVVPTLILAVVLYRRRDDWW